MAALTSKKILVLLTLILFSCICSIAFISTNFYQETAMADSISGDSISINYVGENRFSNNIEGARYKITMPLDSENLYIAFEDDWEWLVCSDVYEEDEIPYIGIDEISITDPELYEITVTNLETQKKEAYVIVKSNGDLYAKCTYADESFSEYSVRVNVIDWVGPKILIETEDYWLDYASNRYITYYSVAFSDIFTGLRYSSASSGLKRVEVFYTSEDLASYVNDTYRDPNQDDLSYEEIQELTGFTFIKAFESPDEGLPLDFQLSDTGYYYYVAEDNVGNITLGFLGKYTQLSPESFNLPLAIGGYLNIYQYLVSAQEDIDIYKEEVNLAQTEALQSAIDSVYYTFLSTSSLERKQSEYSLFVNQWALYKEAITGPLFSIEIENEGEFDGEITCINLDSNTVECINGDSVVLSISVSRFSNDLLLAEIIHPFLQGYSYNSTYFLNYELKVNGTLFLPKLPLIFDFQSQNEIRDIKVVAVINDTNATELISEEGINYFRVSSQLSQANIYIFSTEKNDENYSTNNWVWFVLGSFICISFLTLGCLFVFFYSEYNKNKVVFE